MSVIIYAKNCEIGIGAQILVNKRKTFTDAGHPRAQHARGKKDNPREKKTRKSSQFPEDKRARALPCIYTYPFPPSIKPPTDQPLPPPFRLGIITPYPRPHNWTEREREKVVGARLLKKVRAGTWNATCRCGAGGRWLSARLLPQEGAVFRCVWRGCTYPAKVDKARVEREESVCYRRSNGVARGAAAAVLIGGVESIYGFVAARGLFSLVYSSTARASCLFASLWRAVVRLGCRKKVCWLIFFFFIVPSTIYATEFYVRLVSP